MALLVDATFPVDLQLHSTCSDGTDTPAALVAKAAALGVRVLALTDHDSVLGIDEALAAGTTHGVEIVPALEFSTTADAARDLLDINILGYGIDHYHPALCATLEHVIESRVEQKVRQVERLQDYGIDVPVDEVLAEALGVPGRVHIAAWRYDGILSVLPTSTTSSANSSPATRPIRFLCGARSASVSLTPSR